MHAPEKGAACCPTSLEIHDEWSCTQVVRNNCSGNLIRREIYATDSSCRPKSQRPLPAKSGPVVVKSYSESSGLFRLTSGKEQQKTMENMPNHVTMKNMQVLLLCIPMGRSLQRVLRSHALMWQSNYMATACSNFLLEPKLPTHPV